VGSPNYTVPEVLMLTGLVEAVKGPFEDHRARFVIVNLCQEPGQNFPIEELFIEDGENGAYLHNREEF